MNLNYKNIDGFCSQIDLTIPNPIIDMSSVTFIEPFALIYLRLFVEYNGISTTNIRKPTSNNVRRYLDAQDFWKERGGDFKSRYYPQNQTSFNQIIEIDKTDNLPDEISDYLTNILIGNEVITSSGMDIYRVYELISELIDNFSIHSEQQRASCALQLYPYRKDLLFSIGDCGIGIRGSLSQNPRFSELEHFPHRMAALKAFEYGVSRRHEGGTGLSEVRESVQILGGHLFLSTGDGWVECYGYNFSHGVMKYDLPGVQIGISMPIRS